MWKSGRIQRTKTDKLTTSQWKTGLNTTTWLTNGTQVKTETGGKRQRQEVENETWRTTLKLKTKMIHDNFKPKYNLCQLLTKFLLCLNPKKAQSCNLRKYFSLILAIKLVMVKTSLTSLYKINIISHIKRLWLNEKHLFPPSATLFI